MQLTDRAGESLRLREAGGSSRSKVVVKQHNRNRLTCGLTLLELLCVISIIAVLASILIGPADRVLQRVLADKWSEDAGILLAAVTEQLNQHFQGEQAFPLVTLERIEAEGLVKPAELRFLKDPRVTFVPFAGSDPDDKIVILVQLKRGFFTETNMLSHRKEAVTRVPK